MRFQVTCRDEKDTESVHDILDQFFQKNDLGNTEAAIDDSEHQTECILLHHVQCPEETLEEMTALLGRILYTYNCSISIDWIFPNPVERVDSPRFTEKIGRWPMLDIGSMTPGDALHTLAVHRWISQHLSEIRDLAEKPCEGEVVTAHEAQGEFHQVFTSLECTRFVPLTVAVFTDEDTLAAGEVSEPNVLLYRPLNRKVWAVVDHLHTLDLSAVVKRFGIEGDERTWRRVEEIEETNREQADHEACPIIPDDYLTWPFHGDVAKDKI